MQIVSDCCRTAFSLEMFFSKSYIADSKMKQNEHVLACVSLYCKAQLSNSLLSSIFIISFLSNKNMSKLNSFFSIYVCFLKFKRLNRNFTDSCLREDLTNDTCEGFINTSETHLHPLFHIFTFSHM